MSGDPPPVETLSPDIQIAGLSGLTVGDFWSWAYSDILSNTTRGVFAEFLVGTALNSIGSPRVEWDYADVQYKGHPIEVKSSAFVQRWHQKQLSTIRFDIAKKLSWHAETNTTDEHATRSAEIYVFCLYGEQSMENANPLQLKAWRFYVLPTRRLDEELGEQKTLGLKRLESMCEPLPHGELRARVDSLIDSAFS